MWSKNVCITSLRARSKPLLRCIMQWWQAQHLLNQIWAMWRAVLGFLADGTLHSFFSLLSSHLCPGTLTSITNLATSLARNMDRLSLDEEHYTRQEEWRRQLPESLGDGLRQGLSRLGISLLGMYGYTHTDAKGCLCHQGVVICSIPLLAVQQHRRYVFTPLIRILFYNSNLILQLTDSPSVSIIEKQVVLEQGSVPPRSVTLYIPNMFL